MTEAMRKRRKVAEHGTISKYVKGCRCDACKAAGREYFRAYYEANRDGIAEKQRAYREANRDGIAEKKRAYYEANRDGIAEKKRLSDELQVHHGIAVDGDETVEELQEALTYARAANTRQETA